MKKYIKYVVAVMVVTILCVTSLCFGIHLGRMHTILTEELVYVSESEYYIDHNGRVDVYERN